MIPGDGTGAEICAAARRCIDATGVTIHWDEQPAGLETWEKQGVALPDAALASLWRNRVALKGPIANLPPQSGPLRSVNLFLRQDLDLFACVRPCKLFPGVRSYFQGTPIDLVVIRENTEDLYCGLEFEANKRETEALHELVQRHSSKRIPAGSGFSVKPISKAGSRRIVDYAFDYARRMGRRKVTAVHKANLMKATDGLFLQAAREVAKEYPGIEFEDKLVDSMCMQLVTAPQTCDVLVTMNLYGDILSDLAAGLVGGLGVAPGGNIGERVAIFEAMHGSAAKYKGADRVNPTAIILAGVLLLRHLGEMDAAQRLERAVAATLRDGRYVTYDLKPSRNDPTAVGTSRMADAIVQQVQNSP